MESLESFGSFKGREGEKKDTGYLMLENPGITSDQLTIIGDTSDLHRS
jgi:hypothetical protein